jgi:hypothetical protein
VIFGIDACLFIAAVGLIVWLGYPQGGEGR